MSKNEYYERLKAKNDISEVARELFGDRITKETKHKIYVSCPVHDSESRTSLIIDKDKQLWYCFGCGVGGDVIQLVEFFLTGVVSKSSSGKVKNTHRKARSWLTKRVGMKPLGKQHTKEESKEIERYRAEMDMVSEVLYVAVMIGQKSLLKDPKVLKWVKKTWGYDKNTIKLYGICFIKDSNLFRKLRKKGFIKKQILATGLFKISHNGKNIIPFFNGHVVIPYYKQGKIVNMIGRKTEWTPDIEREKAKYKKLPVYSKNNPDISSFLDNSTFYNEDIVRSNPDYIVITEGISDAISADKNCIPVISPVTTKVKNADEERLKILLRDVPKIFVCNDSEDSGAGDKGAIKTGKMLERSGFEVRIIELPRAEGIKKVDLNDFFRDHTAKDFYALMEKAKKPLQSLIDAIPEDLSETAKYGEVENILHEIHKLPESKRELYIDLLKKRLNIKLGWIRETLKGIRLNTDGNTKNTLMEKAEVFCSEYGPFISVIGRDFFKYENGCLVLTEDDAMEKLADEHLEKIATEQERGCIKRGDRRELLYKVFVLNNVFIGNTDNLNSNRGILNLENGMYDIENDELLDYDIKFYSTIRLPYEYDPSAECSRWIQFLEEVLPDDPVAIDVLQEWAGLCLVPETKFHKALILTGEGSNGKTVFLDILTRLIGEENCSSLRLSDMHDFRLCSLFNKLANIATEDEGKIIQDSSIFKAIVSGDRIEVDRKYKQTLSFNPFCRLTFSTNNLSKFLDTSHALRRRLLIVEFNQTFKGSSDDRDLKIKLRKELPGIFNWALDGYGRLIRRGNFIESDVMKNAVHELMLDSSSVFRFASEKCEVEAGCEITRGELYSAYCDYCETNGDKAKGNRAFLKELRRAVPSIKSDKNHFTTTSDGRDRVVDGIALKDDMDLYTE